MTEPALRRRAGRSVSRSPEMAPLPTTGQPHVSIVVPVYNERDNLRLLHDEVTQVMTASASPFEILYVDDASTDGSDGVLAGLRAGNPRVRTLRLDRHAGQTAALAAGFAAARGAIVVTLDADLQNDPADIPAMIEALGDQDAVVGWRASRRDPWMRRASSRVGNALRNLLSGEDIIDTGCSLKVIRRRALSRIKLYHGMHRFLPTLLRMEGYRVIQRPVNHRPRRTGASKYNLHNRLIRTAADLFAIMWMKRRTLRYRAEEEDPT